MQGLKGAIPVKMMYYLRHCTDIDECAENTHQCGQNCTNNVGSYICFCMTGYILQNDERTCVGELLATIELPNLSLYVLSLTINKISNSH